MLIVSVNTKAPLAKTLKAIHKITGETHALKKIKKQNPNNLPVDQLRREAEILATIVRVLSCRLINHVKLGSPEYYKMFGSL